MATRRKLIVVSNRGPVVFDRGTDGERVAKRGGGGLVTALRSLVEHHDVTWVASAMSDEDRVVAEEAGGEAIEETARGGAPYRLRLVAHDPSAYDWYYNVIANPMLWFIQHYLWGLASAPDVDHGLHHAWNEGYVAVNRGFADAVVNELEREPDAAVSFHDYHLYIAPGLVRRRAPAALISHFVHVPWPMPDYWRVLPETIRRAIHEGLLASNVVSFHTRRWSQSFLRSCADIIGVESDRVASEIRIGDHVTHVRARPISVDPHEFDEVAESEAVLAQEAAIEAARPEFLILRRSEEPLNWMNPPCRLREEEGIWTVTHGKTGEKLVLTMEEIVHDSSHELGVDPGLIKDGVEAHLQELLAEHITTLGAGWTLVRREYMTAIGPVDILCRDHTGATVAVELKRRAGIDAVEQLTRYLELMNRDSLLAPVSGILAAQAIAPQARTLAEDRGIRCVTLDYDGLRGIERNDTLF